MARAKWVGPRAARRGATLTLGLRAYFYLALAHLLAGGLPVGAPSSPSQAGRQRHGLVTGADHLGGQRVQDG
jgi:hypothetical protein